MATLTQIEVQRDPSGLITRTETKQAFTWEDPSNDARSYSVIQNDGVVTIKEEFIQETAVQYAIDVSTSQDPIESHPYFADMTPKQREDWALWKQNPNNPDLNGWTPAQSGEAVFQHLYYLWQRGISNYFAPRIVIKQITVEDGEPDATDVGRISATGYPGNTGSVNFILNGLSAQQEGAKWRVTREYLSSAQGTVWDSSIYS